jgi:hypothetical protein
MEGKKREGRKTEGIERGGNREEERVGQGTSGNKREAIVTDQKRLGRRFDGKRE